MSTKASANVIAPLATRASSSGSTKSGTHGNVKSTIKSVGQEGYAPDLKKRQERNLEKKEREPGFTDPSLPVYIVHSSLAIEEIRAILRGLNAGQVGLVKIDYDRSGKETNRTIVVAEPSVYEAAVEAGLGKRSRKLDFAIAPYELREHNKPFKDCLYSFFIPFPKSFDLSANDARSQVVDLFDGLCQFGLLPADSYRVTVPLKSRESGDAKGSVFVTFAEEASSYAIQLAKVVVDHHVWLSGDEFDSWEELRCFWARDRSAERRAKTGESKEGEKGEKGKGKSKGKKNEAVAGGKKKEEEAPVLEQVTGPIVRTFVNGKAQEQTFTSAGTVIVTSLDESIIDGQAI